MVVEVELGSEMILAIPVLQLWMAAMITSHMPLLPLHMLSRTRTLYLKAMLLMHKMLALMSNINGIVCGLHKTGAMVENMKKSGAACTSDSGTVCSE
jgi:hypothetical protein